MECPPPVLNPNAAVDRQALWEAHTQKCVYCGNPLRLRDLEIEHILPQYLCRSSEHRPELNRWLSVLGLPADYDLNSADNLLPAHAHCNRSKGPHLFDESSIRHFRNLAAAKIPKLSELRERITKQGAADKVVNQAAGHVASGAFTVEFLYDSVTRSRPFSLKDDVQTREFVRGSRPRVRIECKLPTPAAPAGSALVTFRPVEVRGVQVEVDHKTLTRQLFRGTGGLVVPKLRPFLEQPKDLPEVWLVRFGGTLIRVGAEEVRQFCELLDALEPAYLAAFRATEEVFATAGARLIAPDVYEIARVSLPLWNRIVSFVNRHDLADGDSEWHIFDAQCSGMLKIIERSKDGKEWDYACFLDAEACRRDMGAWRRGPEMVSVRWEGSTNRFELTKNSETSQRCSVEQASQFLFGRLIPKAAKEAWTWRSLARLMTAADKEMFADRPERWREMLLSDFATPDQAECPLRQLQEHYLGEHDQFVSPLVIGPLLRFLTQLLAHHELPPYAIDYMSQKLGRRRNLRIRSPLAYVRRRSAEVSGLAPNAPLLGEEADGILRAVLEAINKGVPDAEVQSGWLKWTNDLQPAIRDLNRRAYLERLRAEDWDEE